MTTMSKTNTKKRSLMRLAILTICTTAAIVVTTIFCGAALAGAPATDPLATAGGSATGALDILTTYGPVIGGSYLLFSIAQALLTRYSSSSWFAQGKRLAVATGTLGIIGSALQEQITGAPWTVILAAAVAMAFKLLTPTVTRSPISNATSTSTATATATATAGNAASVSLLLLSIVGVTLGASQVSCGPKTTALAVGIWDCLAPERAEAVDALTPFAESVILAAASADGKLIDTTKIKAATSKVNLQTEAGVLLECAIASAVTALLSQPNTTSATSAAARVQSDGASGLVLSPTALRDMWSQVAPSGTKFRTQHGVL